MLFQRAVTEIHFNQDAHRHFYCLRILCFHGPRECERRVPKLNLSET
jgi:hypothetical protein